MIITGSSLISSAIRMAARNMDLPEDAIFHSDRGSNYTSAEFAAVLQELGIRQSAGRTGICYDNALAESFNASLKVERVHCTAYPTRKRAMEDIARYMSFAIIGSGSTPRSGTGHRRKSTTSTRTGSSQHKFTSKKLSGKRGASQSRELSCSRVVVSGWSRSAGSACCREMQRSPGRTALTKITSPARELRCQTMLPLRLRLMPVIRGSRWT